MLIKGETMWDARTLYYLHNFSINLLFENNTHLEIWLDNIIDKENEPLKCATWLPWWLHGKESTCQCRRRVFHP